MSLKTALAALTLPLLLIACSNTRTLPELRSPSERPAEVQFALPEGYTIQSVDFEAVPDSSGGGRAFVKVLAEDDRTGDLVLFLYEDFRGRTAPLSVYRFKPAGTRR